MSRHQNQTVPDLRPGDILLYGGGFIGRLIQFRTWSDVAHVEIYEGNGKVLASRADGPRRYLLRAEGLRRVIRPTVPFDLGAAVKWFEETASKRPYGYLDLLRFYLINLPTKGLICSEFADLFFRQGGLPLFNTNYPEGAICPGDFEKISDRLAAQVWSNMPPLNNFLC